MIRIHSKGSFRNTETFLRRMSSGAIFATLDRYGQEGVSALAAATPSETGETANSWSYKVIHKKGAYSIEWYNNHVDDNGTPIVILLQYGHGTGTGGYVEGRDFINPALEPIFDRIADDVWKAVTSA